jgi:hypothetical protein
MTAWTGAKERSAGGRGRCVRRLHAPGAVRWRKRGRLSNEAPPQTDES